jgi:hypothetical protein
MTEATTQRRTFSRAASHAGAPETQECSGLRARSQVAPDSEFRSIPDGLSGLLQLFCLPADQFMEREKRFLLYSSGFFVEWLAPEVLARGWHLRLLGKEGTAIMVEITAPKGEATESK